MEKISTLSQLISAFDNQMLIFPDKRGISHFLKIVKHIQGNSDKIPEEYMTRVKTLTKELQPEDSINFVKPIPLPTAANVVLMPRTLKAGFGTRSPKGDQSPLRGLFGQNWSP